MAKNKTNKWKLVRQVGRDMHSYIFDEAICPHGVGHHKGVHGCDGCCAKAPKEIWEKITNEEGDKPTVKEKVAGDINAPSKKEEKGCCDKCACYMKSQKDRMCHDFECPCHTRTEEKKKVGICVLHVGCSISCPSRMSVSHTRTDKKEDWEENWDNSQIVNDLIFDSKLSEEEKHEMMKELKEFVRNLITQEGKKLEAEHLRVATKVIDDFISSLKSKK